MLKQIDPAVSISDESRGFDHSIDLEERAPTYQAMQIFTEAEASIGLTCALIDKDPIVKEGDTAYYESRRIAEGFKQMALSVAKHTMRHVYLLFFLFCTSVLNIGSFESIAWYCHFDKPDIERFTSPCLKVNSNWTAYLIENGYTSPFAIAIVICFAVPLMLSSMCIWYICTEQGRCCCKAAKVIGNYYNYSSCVMFEHIALICSHLAFLGMVIVICVHSVLVGEGSNHWLHLEVNMTRFFYSFPPVIIIAHLIYAVTGSILIRYGKYSGRGYGCIFRAATPRDTHTTLKCCIDLKPQSRGYEDFDHCAIND